MVLNVADELVAALRAAGILAPPGVTTPGVSPFDRVVESDVHHLARVLRDAGWLPPGAVAGQSGSAGVDLQPASWIVRPAKAVTIDEARRLDEAGELCEDHHWYLEVFYDRPGHGWAVRQYRWTESRLGRDGRFDFAYRHSGHPRSHFVWPTHEQALAAARDVVETRTVNGKTFAQYLAWKAEQES